MWKAIGFWCGPDDRSLIHPKHLVDPGWYADDRANLVQYLCSASRACEYLGYSRCRFECGIADQILGNCDLTDGVWCWPSGLAHYVERHTIRLPDEFVGHAASSGWQPPEFDFPPFDYNLEFWRIWCRNNS